MATLEDRERKGALNQALIRAVNERIVDMTSTGAGPTEPLELLCECFDRDCVDGLSLTVREYEEIRSSPTRFPVKRGHVMPEIERVVARTGGYEVVEKFDEAGEIVAARDPRGHAE